MITLDDMERERRARESEGSREMRAELSRAKHTSDKHYEAWLDGQDHYIALLRAMYPYKDAP